MHTEKENTMKLVFNLWLTLLVIWLIANNSLSLDVVLTGIALAALLALAFAPFSAAYGCIRWSPRVLLNIVLYFAVFIEELVRANLSVLRLVLSPRIHIEPGIVEIQTSLKSPIGRLVLANSITLTPGTLVVDTQAAIPCSSTGSTFRRKTRCRQRARSPAVSKSTSR